CLRLRQRFPRAPAKYSRGALERKKSSRRGSRIGHLPCPVFFPPPRSDSLSNGSWRYSPRRGRLGHAVSGTQLTQRNQLRTNLRKSRRNHGREQSASSLPDLGKRRHSQSRRNRTGIAGRVQQGKWFVPSLRLRCARTPWQRARRPRKRSFSRHRSL